jgi:hypothetical protein
MHQVTCQINSEGELNNALVTYREISMALKALKCIYVNVKGCVSMA